MTFHGYFLDRAEGDLIYAPRGAEPMYWPLHEVRARVPALADTELVIEHQGEVIAKIEVRPLFWGRAYRFAKRLNRAAIRAEWRFDG